MSAFGARQRGYTCPHLCVPCSAVLLQSQVMWGLCPEAMGASCFSPQQIWVPPGAGRVSPAPAGHAGPPASR